MKNQTVITIYFLARFKNQIKPKETELDWFDSRFFIFKSNELNRYGYQTYQVHFDLIQVQHFTNILKSKQQKTRANQSEHNET